MVPLKNLVSSGQTTTSSFFYQLKNRKLRKSLKSVTTSEFKFRH